MPHVILKRVWDYCTYSKKYLAFIFILLFISSWIQNYVRANGDYKAWLIVQILAVISLYGYGMLITRSRINHGKRLPKIEIPDIFILGIKSTIVFSCYVTVQGLILSLTCSPLNFPQFDLEEMLLDLPETMNMLYSHNPIHTLIFIILGAILFYITAFFLEIALAKLADTNSMKEAFNLLSIKKSIDVVGWKNYVKDYTLIILSIVILSYMVSFDIPYPFIDSIVDMFLSFLIFATQYLGIGAVYCEIKDLESGR